MSPATPVKPYDPIFDGQKHYRTLLNCTARPGTIGQLEHVQLHVPSQINRSTALLLIALLSAESSCHLASGHPAAADYIRKQTYAVPAAASHADFLVLGAEDEFDVLKQAKSGSLSYPDIGATIILQVAAMSPAPLASSLNLVLTGPGIETEAAVFVSGVREEFFECLQEKNKEFPLGVDAYLTCDSLSTGHCVLALPRTTSVRWTRV